MDRHTDDARPVGDLAERISSRIAREGLAPIPRWRFALSNLAFWGAWLFATALGAAATALVLHDLVSARWDLYEATHENLLTFIFDAAPWVWLLSLAVFVPVGVAAMRATRRGYRMRIALTLALSGALSVSFGLGLYLAGAGRALDALLPVRSGVLRSAAGFERGLWGQPESGRLAGRVVAEAEGDALAIETWDGISWRVIDIDAANRGAIPLVPGAEIRILGLPTSTPGTFQACFVLPWTLREAAPRAPGEITDFDEALVSEGCRAMTWYEKFSARFPDAHERPVKEN